MVILYNVVKIKGGKEPCWQKIKKSVWKRRKYYGEYSSGFLEPVAIVKEFFLDWVNTSGLSQCDDIVPRNS